MWAEFLSRHLTSFLHLKALRVSDDRVLYWADASKDSVHLPICASHTLWVSLLALKWAGHPKKRRSARLQPVSNLISDMYWVTILVL